MQSPTEQGLFEAHTEQSGEKMVRDIQQVTRRSAEVKIRIVQEGLRAEVSIAELCRREGINQNSVPV